MAITVTSPQARYGKIYNAVSGDLSACEEIAAAVSGKKIKIRHITINSGGAITITIGAGETGGAVTTALIGPVNFAANTSMQWDFNPLMELDANTSLTVDSSGAGNACIFVQCFVE